MMLKRPPKTVFIVDDDQEVRRSLKWLIESIGLRVKTFTDARMFLDGYRPGQAGCVVLDVRMPGMSGLELMEKLSENKASIPVIIITGHADVPMAVRALKSGAIDFIEKPFSDQLLLDRIQSALDVDSRNREDADLRAKVAARFRLLSEREREIMGLVAAGKTNKEIAEELDLSQKTIEYHRSSLMRKLEADSLAELVRYQMLVAT